MKIKSFIVQTFFCALVLIQPLIAKEPAFQIQSIEEVFPGIYQKLKNENRISSFDLSQLTLKRDKAAILYRDKIEIINSKGSILVSYQLDDYGLSIPSEHNSWNADGTQFICSISSKDGRMSLYLLDIIGNLKELVPAPEFRGQVLQPEWSYDGNYISYIKSTLRPEPKSSVYILNVYTGEEKQIGNNLSGKAKWMNHSNKLFYENAIPPFNTTNRPLRELYCFDVRDNSNIRFYSEPFSSISITLPADDLFIGIHSDNILITLDLFGHEIKKIEINPINPQFSPDGKNIAFIHLDEDGHRIINQFIKILDLKKGSIVSISIDNDSLLRSILWIDESRILYN